MSDLIKVGDTVDVHFVDGDYLLNAKVIGTPADVGDSWKLVMPDGQAVNVVLYARMSRRQYAL